jgi:hypothetical protein
LNEKWLHINEETVFGEVTSCIKITELNILGNFTHRFNCKWGKPSARDGTRFREVKREVLKIETLYCLE